MVAILGAKTILKDLLKTENLRLKPGLSKLFAATLTAKIKSFSH